MFDSVLFKAKQTLQISIVVRTFGTPGIYENHWRSSGNSGGFRYAWLVESLEVPSAHLNTLFQANQPVAKCSFGILFIHWYSALPTALRVSSRPRMYPLICGFNQKSQCDRSGLYGGCGYVSMLFSCKYSVQRQNDGLVRCRVVTWPNGDHLIIQLLLGSKKYSHVSSPLPISSNRLSSLSLNLVSNSGVLLISQ